MTTINVSTDSSGNVTLSNNGNATSPRKGEVQWNVTGSLLKTIAIRPFIQPNTNQTDIWSAAPAPFPNNNPPDNVSINWQGTVFDNDGEEYYYLDWTKKDNTTGTIDPKITVRATNR